MWGYRTRVVGCTLTRMKKLVGVVAAVLVLAGCTAAPSGDGDEAPDSSSQRVAPEETSAPAEPEAVWPYTVREDGENIYLGALRNQGLWGMDDATDEELIAYGHAACEQLAAGVGYDDVEVIPTDYPSEPYVGWNDRSLTGLASETLCTEYDQQKFL